MRQTFAVHNLFARLFEIFHYVRNGRAERGIIVYRFKIRASETVIEIGVLVRYLPFVRVKVIVVDFYHHRWHCAFGYIEKPVKVQSLFLR